METIKVEERGVERSKFRERGESFWVLKEIMEGNK